MVYVIVLSTSTGLISTINHGDWRELNQLSSHIRGTTIVFMGFMNHSLFSHKDVQLILHVRNIRQHLPRSSIIIINSPQALKTQLQYSWGL